MTGLKLSGIEVRGKALADSPKILSPDALNFLKELHQTFNARRKELLNLRSLRQKALDKGEKPKFLSETEAIRKDKSWKVSPAPEDLQKRYVEITGPVERKMMINALNSGADVFMADFEDALSPTWQNLIEGQKNLIDTVNGTIAFESPEGKKYRLNEKIAVLMVRPRGFHLVEKHLLIDGEPISASLFDFGLYLFHNYQALLQKEKGPYFYLPKLESHLEARLWNDIFNFASKKLGLKTGTIKATVLIETILAAFEMEEILYELKEHIVGLNAGRWDYIFSIIKKFVKLPHLIFPDRAEITMTVPFMRAYTELLVKTCHSRGAHAIGGMAAFIPNRKEKEITEIALKKVREDKLRESQDGFDGTWVAHPDLVLVAREIFEKALKGENHQKNVLKNNIQIQPEELLNFSIPGGKITESGFRNNISVSLHYLSDWLKGQGAVAINNLMEDAATCEIARSELWSWVHSGEAAFDSHSITKELFDQLLEEEAQKLSSLPKITEAKAIISSLVHNDQFEEFLTLKAYEKLD